MGHREHVRFIAKIYDSRQCAAFSPFNGDFPGPEYGHSNYDRARDETVVPRSPLEQPTSPRADVHGCRRWLNLGRYETVGSERKGLVKVDPLCVDVSVDWVNSLLRARSTWRPPFGESYNNPQKQVLRQFGRHAENMRCSHEVQRVIHRKVATYTNFLPYSLLREAKQERWIDRVADLRAKSPPFRLQAPDIVGSVINEHRSVLLIDNPEKAVPKQQLNDICGT